MVSPLSPIQVQQQQPDIAGSLLAGRRSFQQSQLLGQAAQQNQQQITREDYEMGVQRARLISQLAARARQLPPEQRGQFISTLNPEMLRSVGIDPAQAATVPLDDQGLDTYIAQINSVIPQEQQANRVQSSQILDDGTTIQLLADGQSRVTDPAGNEITGEARRKAIQDANRYGADIQAQRAGMRTSASLEARSGLEPQLQADITRAKQEAAAEVEKQIKQQGQLGKLSDAERIYNRMRDSDLDVIYGQGEKWYPEFLRSQKGIDLIADRDQILGMLQLGARGELQGQGSIAEGEQKILSNAVSALGSPNISPARAREALDEAMIILRRNAGKGPATDGDGRRSAAPSGAPEGYAERRRRLLGY